MQKRMKNQQETNITDRNELLERTAGRAAAGLNAADEDSKKGENSPNAVDKTLSVIDCIFERELSFTEIREQLDMPKATLHRILQSLESRDFVARDEETERYRLGMKFIYYGEALKSKLSLISIAENSVKELARITGESSCLSILYNNAVFTLVAVEGDASALTSRLIPISPLNCSASGKIYLASRSDEELRAYFNSGSWVRKTANSICTFEDYKAEQKRILSSQLSYDNEEYEYGLFCIASQLSNHTGKINASLGITGPTARIHTKDIPAIEAELKHRVAEVSDILTKIKYEFEYQG